MEDVRIYDFEFNLLHIEHDISSCNWTLYENEIGTFEMHFPLSSRLVPVMMEHRYLVAVQGNKQAIVTGRQVSTEGVLYGRSCNWLLTRFCIPDSFDTDALFDAGVIAAKDAQTVCQYVIHLALDGLVTFKMNTERDFGEIFLENQSVCSVFELVQKCMASDGGGHELVFDPSAKQWFFRVTKGQRLSSIFSEENRNAYETAYTEDLQNYLTGGWFEQSMEHLGEWDAGSNSPKLVNNTPENFAKGYRVSVGGTRFGITFASGDYIVCKDKAGTWEKANKIEDFPVQIPSKTIGLYAWESFLNGRTETEALSNLDKKSIQQELTAKMKGLVYGRDYVLGDLVWTEVVKGSFRKSQIRKIIGVRLWYEQNDIGEEPMMEEAEE